MKKLYYILFLTSLVLCGNLAYGMKRTCDDQAQQTVQETHYEFLGVPRNSTTEEITKAYRKLAMQYHPDKNTGHEEKFKHLTNVYEALGNVEKRKHYDNLLQFSEFKLEKFVPSSSSTYNNTTNLPFKKCSHCSCTNRIPTFPISNLSPCCPTQKISLCEMCAVKSQIQCSSCYKNIEIESTNGLRTLKKPVEFKSDTLLHDACKLGNYDVIKFLLEHKAHVNVLDDTNNMPLHYACDKNNYSISMAIVELLFKYGANVHGANVNLLKNDRWRTPLHYACNTGNVAITQLLLMHGAKVDINRLNFNDCTPLQLAQQNNDHIIIHLLNEWLKK